MNSFTVESKHKPKWYEFRYKFAAWLVKVARWIYPAHPETTAFLMQQMTDYMIYGKHVMRVDPDSFNEQDEKNEGG